MDGTDGLAVRHFMLKKAWAKVNNNNATPNIKRNNILNVWVSLVPVNVADLVN